MWVLSSKLRYEGTKGQEILTGLAFLSSSGWFMSSVFPGQRNVGLYSNPAWQGKWAAPAEKMGNLRSGRQGLWAGHVTVR